MIKILTLELMILLEYENIKTFLQKAIFQIGLKKFLLSQKLKTLCRGHMILGILKMKKLLELFMKKNCKKQIKKRFRDEKLIKRKGDKLYVKCKRYKSSFNRHSIND